MGVIIDYKIIYPTPHARVSKKVFKIKKSHLSEGETLEIEKKHPLKKMTTKKLYSGKYLLQIQINGKILGETEFHLHSAYNWNY